jgi:hypothetical protein
VVSASPLVLEHADEVILLDGGRERARGAHRDLLARAAAGDPDAVAYRAVVTREAAAPDEPAGAVPGRPHGQEAR